MSTLPELELKFEILTLSNNIEKLKSLGYRTADLQSRLDYCKAQFLSLNSGKSTESFISGELKLKSGQ